MTVIKPFKALHFNPEKIKSFAEVVSPPYDVISADKQKELYNRSPYNFVRVYFGKETPKDNENDNRYTRSKAAFEEWLKTGILVEDQKPSLYYYKQEYSILGQRYSRLGFISLMKLGEEGGSKVYPHENTQAKAKEDRTKLLQALKSNLSCIFVCFSDKAKKVETIFNTKVAVTKPFVDVVDDDKVRHTLWKLDDQKLIDEIAATFEDQHLFIADGHHRYEVSMQYRQSRLRNQSQVNGDEPFNFVMTYFTNMDSKNLQIFPIHRIIKKCTANLDFLEEFFRIDRVKNREDLAVLLAKAGLNEYAFGMHSRAGTKLLRLKNKLIIDKEIQEGSKDYRHLDATILKSLIFDRVGITADDIIYTKDINEAMKMVDEKQADLSFIMNPVKIQQLKAIALNGEKMPPKTTYFYPKVLSGLTVYKME